MKAFRLVACGRRHEFLTEYSDNSNFGIELWNFLILAKFLKKMLDFPIFWWYNKYIKREREVNKMKRSMRSFFGRYGGCWCIEECTQPERKYEKKRTHKTLRRKEREGIRNYE